MSGIRALARLCLLLALCHLRKSYVVSAWAGKVACVVRIAMRCAGYCGDDKSLIAGGEGCMAAFPLPHKRSPISLWLESTDSCATACLPLLGAFMLQGWNFFWMSLPTKPS